MLCVMALLSSLNDRKTKGYKRKILKRNQNSPKYTVLQFESIQPPSSILISESEYLKKEKLSTTPFPKILKERRIKINKNIKRK